MKPVHLLRLHNFSIFKQLQIEEALFRCKDAGNWVIINQGTPDPMVVMGISGKPDRLVNLDKAVDMGVPIIKRFTGGGTVIVDQSTLFASFIMDIDWLTEHAGLKSKFPRDIMKWSEGFYRQVFSDHQDFSLMEHDYSFGVRKFGGNAQAVSRNRFVHHTSFLFDFINDRMSVLKQPENTPKYREGRDHLSFLCKLKDRYENTETIATNIENAVRSINLNINNNSNSNNNISSSSINSNNNSEDINSILIDVNSVDDDNSNNNYSYRSPLN
ncbi:hypothetical protein PPL_02936 [Heterostelium album PN500]|uniref:BPL/LPL catalytic domain-containing protein n=1 Tax=Heterostelium pallidum (strain ATCC 26659 / Pp 5 / PN500) TaxID=670386 RepID=D3B3G8_HETP5|nr:hypothetical protein PPL_02936 [Heterostelium album PN500]EFA83866.1 hypothetical protein PPL_02936 [Heterostelium album PN500]|eukprot:XP_020435983.1 hypothetical protein PPL_02936 [Heterostelium album PN500]